ncbi:MAG TPA: NADPH-dependent ferric siderophore reductase [Oceanospirillales bacterium]|nr:NADPH-dependent ferric siderophore reductase [Oceanospirillaceae bacterium]HBS41653.1 NADPH-dependent ferric siderophore reductase [Oceanospirillales bacterium]|tara:strand:- start:7440 stop:8216 length:777 start_codon:yes stop_codon:yes gene_type:complete
MIRLFRSRELPGETQAPVIEQVRHELRMRRLRVKDRQQLTPNMIRIVLEGDDLKGFTSQSPDDHVKVFLPQVSGEPAKRDYTPRRFDAQNNELTLDFAVHDAGPATAWAMLAQPGDWIDIGGPRASQKISGDIRHWLLIGDETALPAIARRIEELGNDDQVTALVSIAEDGDQQTFSSRAVLDSHWLTRESSARTDAIIEHLNSLALPPQTFCWIAGESSMVRSVRQYLLNERGISKPWIKASGYWKEGHADSAEHNL